jgi:hypothetical protein
MSVLFMKLAGTTFFLFIFFVILTLMTVDRNKLYQLQWQDQPVYVKSLGLVLGFLVISTATSLIGSIISSIWGY